MHVPKQRTKDAKLTAIRKKSKKFEILIHDLYL